MADVGDRAGKKLQRQFSILDREKLTYQKEMNSNIQAASQKYRRRLGELVTKSSNQNLVNESKTDSGDSDTSDDDGKEVEGAETPVVKGSSKPTPVSGSTRKPRLMVRSRTFSNLPSILTKPKNQTVPIPILRRRVAASVSKAKRAPPVQRRNSRDMLLPRRAYGLYEGFACLSLVHPITHMVLQNSQVHQMHFEQLEAAKHAIVRPGLQSNASQDAERRLPLGESTVGVDEHSKSSGPLRSGLTK